MNIVVVGGGKRFGKDLVDQFRLMGHNVYVLSHIQYENADSNHLHANFKNITDIITAFNQLTDGIGIDILFYNSNVDVGPYDPKEYQSTLNYTKEKIEERWITNFRVAVTIPHAIAIAALSKMNVGGKIMFMTSGLSLRFYEEYSFNAGYAGCKSAQNFLMYALAMCNDRNITACSLYTHIPYEDMEKYEIVLRNAIEQILKITHLDNGKILYF